MNKKNTIVCKNVPILHVFSWKIHFAISIFTLRKLKNSHLLIIPIENITLYTTNSYAISSKKKNL